MTGADMILLRHRVGRCGFITELFRYRSVRATVRTNAARLQHFLTTLDADVVHFVGHSLGGLVIRRLFHDYPAQRPGRIVTLGTPHGGSQVARSLSRFVIGRKLLGRSVDRGLLGDMPPWTGERELGVVAGTVGVGPGLLITRLARPNDGTVAVAEAGTGTMTDYIEVRVSHTALLFSAEVARQVCVFLRSGRFDHSEPPLRRSTGRSRHS